MMLIELKCGDWFTTPDGGHYIKIEPITVIDTVENSETTCYAICLETGKLSIVDELGHPAWERTVIPLAQPIEWHFRVHY
jgi:hypothetical protein